MKQYDRWCVPSAGLVDLYNVGKWAKSTSFSEVSDSSSLHFFMRYSERRCSLDLSQGMSQECSHKHVGRILAISFYQKKNLLKNISEGKLFCRIILFYFVSHLSPKLEPRVVHSMVDNIHNIKIVLNGWFHQNNHLIKIYQKTYQAKSQSTAVPCHKSHFLTSQCPKALVDNKLATYQLTDKRRSLISLEADLGEALCMESKKLYAVMRGMAGNVKKGK